MICLLLQNCFWVGAIIFTFLVVIQNHQTIRGNGNYAVMCEMMSLPFLYGSPERVNKKSDACKKRASIHSISLLLAAVAVFTRNAIFYCQ